MNKIFVLEPNFQTAEQNFAKDIEQKFINPSTKQSSIKAAYSCPIRRLSLKQYHIIHDTNFSSYIQQ